MSESKSKYWLLAILLPLGFAGVWQLQKGIDQQKTKAYQESDELVLRSAKVMKAMSLEYAPLMADIYWTRAVQYYGAKHAAHDRNLKLLWPLLDLATTLDPNLLVAYRFGSTFVSEPSPRGAGEPQHGIELLERGIKANPDEWRLYEDLGYIYYFELKDYAKASAAFEKGSENPKALIWMKVMAAKIAADGESFSTSVFLWNEVYQSTKDPDVRKNAETHLQLLKVEQDCRQLDALADEYEKRMGRRPTRTGELVAEGFLKHIPVDPLGYAYIFEKDGKAALNLKSPLVEQQLLQPN
ncbi:MAG TPA: hypothetical protein VJN93_10940 [Candidatus Acidoferrum sp.]|nr:hypothetical protein [Candidatus Acidoferrum sp.]